MVVKTRGVGGSKMVTTDTGGVFPVQRLAAGQVYIYSRGEPRISVGNIELAATGREGDFAFDALGNGVRLLHVSAPGFVATRLTVDPAEMAGPHWVSLLSAEH